MGKNIKEVMAEFTPERVAEINRLIDNNIEISRVFSLFAERVGLEEQEALGPSLEHHAARCEILGIENILPHKPVGGTNGAADDGR